MSERYDHRLIVKGEEEVLGRFYEENRSLENENALECDRIGSRISEADDLWSEWNEWKGSDSWRPFIYGAYVQKNYGILDYNLAANDFCDHWVWIVSQLFSKLTFQVYCGEPYCEYDRRFTFTNGQLIDYSDDWWFEDEVELFNNPRVSLSGYDGVLSIEEAKAIAATMKANGEEVRVSHVMGVIPHVLLDNAGFKRGELTVAAFRRFRESKEN